MKAISVLLLFMAGCTIGKHDSDNLRIIPFTEWSSMDDKGFPLNLFQPEQDRISPVQPKL